jgi:hypothetical protein
MDMAQQPRPKRRRGGQPKPAAERKRNNLTFRARDQLRADLEKAASEANRSMSEEIEYRLGRALQWEKVLGDVEAFRAQLAEYKIRFAEAERQRKLYDPSPQLGLGARWFLPGMHNIPESGFEDPNAPPPSPTLPPVVREAVRVEVQTAVREILEEAGLLSRKKSGGAAG